MQLLPSNFVFSNSDSYEESRRHHFLQLILPWWFIKHANSRELQIIMFPVSIWRLQLPAHSLIKSHDPKCLINYSKQSLFVQFWIVWFGADHQERNGVSWSLQRFFFARISFNRFKQIAGALIDLIMKVFLCWTDQMLLNHFLSQEFKSLKGHGSLSEIKKDSFIERSSRDWLQFAFASSENLVQITQKSRFFQSTSTRNFKLL